MRSLSLMNLLQTRKLFHDYFKPCTNYVVTYSQLNQVKKFSTNSQKRCKDDKNDESQSLNLTGSFGATHKVFADRDAEIILDVSERQETINLEDLRIEEEYPDPYEGINTEREYNYCALLTQYVIKVIAIAAVYIKYIYLNLCPYQVENVVYLI